MKKSESTTASVSAFMEKHYRHYNARETLSAAKAYKSFIENDNGAMLVSLAGAMSTAELGISLAEMIRAGKIHAISCTAANLEEDLFNLFAHNEYKVIDNWRALSTQDEIDLRDSGYNRVTDTCIPETVMMHMQDRLVKYWKEAADQGKQYFAYEYMFRILDDKELEQHYQIPREHSWMIAAKEAGIPIYSPGIEDSTLGNMFTARVMDGTVSSHSALKTGTQQLENLARWYKELSQTRPIGFFQIGGGIAGDFAICAVPMWIQDLDEANIRRWAYFSQISDAETSYGGYSGAVPNEKITWNKLEGDCPKFMIHSDATIVAPLIFAYVLGQ
jgi:deoxyhypusine synthase